MKVGAKNSVIRAAAAAAAVAIAAVTVAPAQAPAPSENVGDTANAGDTALIERGHEVYDYWCAPCHAPGPRHPGTQALQALYDGEKPAALEARTDLVPQITRTFVREGVSIMPPFRKTEITDEELEALAAYLAPSNR